MICEYQSLYYGDDGFVVRCRKCGHYQIAYLNISITLDEIEYHAFCRIVAIKCAEVDDYFSANSKCIVIDTPAPGVCFMFTRAEGKRFIEILEEADNEAKAQALISLFNKPPE